MFIGFDFSTDRFFEKSSAVSTTWRGGGGTGEEGADTETGPYAVFISPIF
jgi:hypothetical protein